jgi:hypothetical protein
MRKLTTLAVSLVAVFAVSHGAFAEGLATGEWVNKYFVDFTAHDHPTADLTGTLKTSWDADKKVVVSVTPNVATGTITYNTVPVSDIADGDTQYTNGEGLNLTGTEFSAKTDGTNVYINNNKQITTDKANIAIPSVTVTNATTGKICSSGTYTVDASGTARCLAVYTVNSDQGVTNGAVPSTAGGLATINSGNVTAPVTSASKVTASAESVAVLVPKGGKGTNCDLTAPKTQACCTLAGGTWANSACKL